MALLNVVRPGVFANVTSPLRAPTTVPFRTSYMFGFATSGPTNTPTLVTSLDDFNTQFAGAPTIVVNSVKRLFQIDPTHVLYYVRATETIAADETDLANSIDAVAATPEGLAMGYVFCPQASTMAAAIKAPIDAALTNFAASPLFLGFALLDNGSDATTTTAINAEVAARSNANGFNAYYAGRYDFGGGELLPHSPIVAATAVARHKAQGIQEPPAGTDFPVARAIGLVPEWTTAELEVLADNNVNVSRNIPGAGFCIYDAQTTSNDTNWQFIHHRIIFNVIIRSIEKTFLFFLFRSFGRSGQAITALKVVGEALMGRLYAGNLLYGGTPQEAYRVIADASNQNAVDLENGVVAITFVLVPTGIMRQIAVTVARSPIGQLELTASLL